ncbi:uncharacterized protein LOC128883803 isoform X2 [Hylaeus volcanicus]|uniref:uncharacterized protein LOC128883803 isoform X2 n=1 Tax=Hylaeus volcanicus TaxID=313075 RepID=UPI0023B8053A|nr:uncharacterized protein LOC128883803 isoform X2 [Hylaeus volcanicus]
MVFDSSPSKSFIETQKKLRKKNVFLYYPNILGYIRIVLVFIALYSAFRSWKTLCICYTISQLLDAADGVLARYFSQATVFGSVLDQVTDRLSTVTILLLDSIVHPEYYFWFCLVLILDLSGHWVHTFASICAGSKSHKNIPTTWPFLKLYYERKVFMFLCHSGNEFVWITIFLLTQLHPHHSLVPLLYTILIPSIILCLFKNVTNVAQLIYGAQVLGAVDLS